MALPQGATLLVTFPSTTLRTWRATATMMREFTEAETGKGARRVSVSYPLSL